VIGKEIQFFGALALSLQALCLTAKADPNEFVDLELVLAVDVSHSIDIEEQRIQRDGYVATFRDPDVINAMLADPNGRIAVTYLEWAGQNIQSVIVPWRVVCHEYRRSKRRCVTVREMKEGPSGSVVRDRSQATASCCRKERWW
jgi:hypothetical protein